MDIRTTLTKQTCFPSTRLLDSQLESSLFPDPLHTQAHSPCCSVWRSCCRAYPHPGGGQSMQHADNDAAGNRWHLNCFRCNTCGTLLDSDANLLLLGDG